MFINIHSHVPGPSGTLTIQSLYKDFGSITADGHYSLGMHPWYTETDNWEKEWAHLSPMLKYNQVLAIGECGLDKVCRTDWHLQEEVFRVQLLRANEVRKPVIIHCVRAFDEVLRMIRDTDLKTPCIFHGYNNSLQTAERILRAGHYLSFGHQLAHVRMADVFRQVPGNRYFLETDDREISIESVYKMAANARSESTESVILQLQQNFTKVFGLNPEDIA